MLTSDWSQRFSIVYNVAEGQMFSTILSLIPGNFYAPKKIDNCGKSSGANSLLWDTVH
jgi:hypothetical protein